MSAVDYAARAHVMKDRFGAIHAAPGGWAEYANVDFGNGVTNFQARIASLARNAGSLKLRLDSPTGPLIGTLKLTGTGGLDNYTVQTTAVTGATGVHNLYLVFVGAASAARIDSINFTTAPPTQSATNTFQAINYAAQSGITQDDGATTLATIGGAWTEYSQVDFGAGVSSFTASITAPRRLIGRIQLRLDGPDGLLLGTVKVTGNGELTDYKLKSTALKRARGVHDLYLVFIGARGAGNVESFSFGAL